MKTSTILGILLSLVSGSAPAGDRMIGTWSTGCVEKELNSSVITVLKFDGTTLNAADTHFDNKTCDGAGAPSFAFSIPYVFTNGDGDRATLQLTLNTDPDSLTSELLSVYFENADRMTLTPVGLTTTVNGKTTQLETPKWGAFNLTRL